jgi:hypothetical protein
VLSGRREVALLLVLAAGAVLLALVPGLNTPVSRLAAYDGDGREPLYDANLDAAAIRRAGELLPDDATYAVYAPAARPLLAGNLKAAAQLFLAPALPLHDPRQAEWVLSYGAVTLLPAGLRPLRVHLLGSGSALVQVRR